MLQEYRTMPKRPPSYSVSYNPNADVWAIYLGERRITTAPTEPDAWKYIQGIEAAARIRADGSPHGRRRARA